MGFSERLQKSWYSPKKDGLSTALLDVSWLYGGIVRLRRKLYTSGLLRSTQLAVPVIVVGNVIAGGAGKTPIVMEIARFLQTQAWRVGIISRGYGRKSESVLEVLADTPARESGDEPALIKRTLQHLSIPVFVARDRAEAARALLAAHPQVNVILCDDGLQHLALQRDIEICVFDERGIGNGRLLPAGPLREPWPRAVRHDGEKWPGAVDFVLHRAGAELGLQEGFEIERRLADEALLADGSRISYAQLAQHELTAVAGIAHPTNFFNMLRERGLHLQHTIALPDHFDFNSDLRSIHKRKWLICTEKDAVKLWATPLAQQCTIAAVPLQVTLPEAFTTALLEKLSSLEQTN